MPIALARRYRPKRFTDLLVQDHVAAVLRGAVLKDRVGHGYLLTGPRGVGKTTAARILAMALNCENKGHTDPPGEPCGECTNCLRIWNGSANIDVVEIDAASNRGVDDARELRERAMYAASQEGHHKVYIVDEAHMLTREAWNALLKILEEPPPGVVFVFATTEPQKIANAAAPVMSRLQRFDFRRIGAGAIRDRLRQVLELEKISADEDALTLIARHADGGMRDALSVLDQCLSFGEGAITAERVRQVLGLIGDELYAELLEIIIERRPAGVFSLVDRIMDAGGDLVEFIGGASEMLRALLMLQVGAEPEGLTEGMRQALVAAQDRLATGDALRMLRLVAESEGGVRRSGDPRLVVETLLLRWTLMDRIVSLEAALGGAPAVPSDRAPSSRGPAPVPSTKARPAAPVTEQRPAARPPAPRPPDGVPEPEAPASAQPAPAPSLETVPFTLGGLLGAWDDLVIEARSQSRFLGEAMTVTRPVEVAPPRVTLALPDDNPMHAEALERQKKALESLLERRVGTRVQVRIAPPATGGPAKPVERPRRLSDTDVRNERLRAMSAKDPALETAAGELDLEVLE
ncbi:MAG: DNA polymerase III subunit gamma/tau [Gemmatimonadota bacterium]